MNDNNREWLDALPEAFKTYSRGRDIDEVP